MKQSKAIELLRKGEITLHNDLGSKGIKQSNNIIDKSFENTPYSDKQNTEKYPYIQIHKSEYKYNCYDNKDILLFDLPIIKLSSISKGKNKRKQLEKSFSELSKEVAECVKKTNDIQISVSALQIGQLGSKGDWGAIIPSEKETPIKEEEIIDYSKVQILVSIDNKLGIITNGNSGEKGFAGTVVFSKTNNLDVGDFHTLFIKREFKKGTLTINQ